MQAAELATPTQDPFALPRSEADWLAWVRLIRSRRVGPGTFHRLMREHGSAAAALAELPAIARATGTDDYETCPEGVAAAELKAGRLAGAVPVAFGAPAYPDLLGEIADPPPLVWALGNLDLISKPGIGLVGARNASSLGLRMARKLAADLGRQEKTIVSGLARGIDTAAHEGALQTGTVAVMPGGVDIVYPKENAVLAQQIQEQGLRLSENPPGTMPQARHFAQRNRLISGLSRALIIVEAAAKSGSLITARAALDQGRDVLAVPGHPFDARAAGCNMLIRDGATLVRSSADILEQLETDEPKASAPRMAAAAPAEPAAGRTPAPEDDQNLHRQILGMLSPSPLTEDQLIRDLALPASAVISAVSRLEVEGKLARRGGGKICRP